MLYLNNLINDVVPNLVYLIKDKVDGILDLFNTFNPMDDSLYRSQIEPSSKGGELITELIMQVIIRNQREEGSRNLMGDKSNGQVCQF